MASPDQSKILSVVILTRDEQEHLPVCLESLADLNAEIFVVDSGSLDATCEIARAFGATVVAHPFATQAAQVNWALEHLPIRTPWVMRLDADERLTPELAAELRTTLGQAPDDVFGMTIKRRVVFWGRWIRHGGCYPIWLLRVWRNGQARCEPRWMDEHILLAGGRIGKLRHDIIDENRKTLQFWVDKHNEYAGREVKDLQSIEPRTDNRIPAGQMGRRRWFKQNLYVRMPLFWRALFYWAYRYFILLGFLDGKPGLVFHFLQGFWYRFLVDAKLYEARRKGGQSAPATMAAKAVGNQALPVSSPGPFDVDPRN